MSYTHTLPEVTLIEHDSVAALTADDKTARRTLADAVGAALGLGVHHSPDAANLVSARHVLRIPYVTLRGDESFAVRLEDAAAWLAR